MTKRHGWIAFLEWSGAAAALVFAVISAASVGLFILPLALVASLLVARDARIWPEGLGALGGAGIVFLAVAFINRNSLPCASSGSALRVGLGEKLSCGGRDPTSWLWIGAALVCSALFVYALSRGRRAVTD